MTVFDKEKLELFHSSIDILSGKQSSQAYYDVVRGLFDGITNRGLYDNDSGLKFLSLLLNVWMKGMIRNYKLDRFYSEQRSFGFRPKSMLRELDILAGFPDIEGVGKHSDYTTTDYHLPEFLSIADDVKTIMRERGWIESE